MTNDPLTEWPDGYIDSFAGVHFERPPQEPAKKTVNDGETSFTAPPDDEAALLAALAEDAGTLSSDDLLKRLR
jgi:hypothetical protein